MPIKKKRKRSRPLEVYETSISDHPSPSVAAVAVAANDDLLIQILLRLPIRPLLRFKCVSTHWLSLITDPTFSLLRNSRPSPVSGLILQRVVTQELNFIPVNDDDPEAKPPFTLLNFVKDPCGIKILQSCNGLLCCCSNLSFNGKYKYYIYNPTTNKFSTLPDPNRRVFRRIRGEASVCAVNIAFDPSISPHYKAVCVYCSKTLRDHFEIEIYSSETGLWTPSGDPFLAGGRFINPVYWNGSIHWWWCTSLGNSLYFNLNTEHIGTMPLPPPPKPPMGGNWEVRSRDEFLGESGGHLHLIQIYCPQTTHFNVYEMERDYSKWVVKYNVDLDSIAIAFAKVIYSSVDPSDLYYFGFSVWDVVRGEKDEDSFLVVGIPGKAIRYNLVDKTFKKLCDIIPGDPTCEFTDYDTDWSGLAFQFIESLAFV